MSEENKGKFVNYACIILVVFLFILVLKALDNEQPSVEDVMTNNGPTISDFLEQ